MGDQAAAEADRAVCLGECARRPSSSVPLHIAAPFHGLIELLRVQLETMMQAGRQQKRLHQRRKVRWQPIAHGFFQGEL